MMKKLSPELKRILEAGNSAPSGENCQPWHFVMRGAVIEVHMLPDRDQSAYSCGQRASFFAVGAVLENIVIAASAEGYRATIEYFPRAAREVHVADIHLEKDAGIIADPLAASIMNRVTNRKPYAKDALTEAERVAVLSAAKQADGDLVLLEERGHINRLGRIGSVNEEVMLANHLLHEFFFDHVNWTKEGDDKKKIGFYIKTLELPPPAEMMFKAFRHWPVMRVLSAIGFNRVVAAINAKQNASAAAIGAFLIDETDPLDFVRAGRAIERVWLAATSAGLSFQPLSGILFFKLKIDADQGSVFFPDEKTLITDACQEISQMVKADGKHVAFLFRLGHAPAPSARAVRFPLDEVVTMES